MLIGLASKNAILIVEFARELEEKGRSTIEAALEASGLRLRPIIMTSIAFIAGVVPLMLGTGAGAEVRQVLGVTVFAGMLGVTFFGLFLNPFFYVALRKLAMPSPAAKQAQACRSNLMSDSTLPQTSVRAWPRLHLALTPLAALTTPGPRRPQRDSMPASMSQRRHCPCLKPTRFSGAAWSPRCCSRWWKMRCARVTTSASLWHATNRLLRFRVSAARTAIPLYRHGGTQRPTRQYLAGAGGVAAGRDGELHDASLSAVWELDLFGRARRTVQAQQAETAATAADLAGVQVAIEAELADAYFGLRGLQVQVPVAHDNEINQADTLRLIGTLLENRRGTSFDSDRASTQLALTRARIPPLEAEAAAAGHRIAVLTGRSPAQGYLAVMSQCSPSLVTELTN